MSKIKRILPPHNYRVNKIVSPLLLLSYLVIATPFSPLRFHSVPPTVLRSSDA